MARSRVPLEQLLANLQSYHTYLLQDPCVSRPVLEFVEQRISFCQGMSSLKSGSIDSGEQGGCEKSTCSPGPRAWNGSSSKETVTT